MPDSASSQSRFAGDLTLTLGYRRLLRRSLWVFVAAALGGLFGLGAARLTPPVFRSTAVLAIGVDYGRSQWLDEDADRLVMGRVQGLILSDAVLAEVLDRSATGSPDGGSMPRSAAELRDDLRLVWVDNRWELSFVSRDPERAAALANVWAEVALDHLAMAWEHAWQVAELQSLYFEVFCRPERPPGGQVRALWVCDEGRPGTDQADASTELLEQIEASQGIIPALSFGWEARASAPATPETGSQTAAILGGMLAGLLAGTLGAVTVSESRT